MVGTSTIVDLKSAYFQLCIVEKLWKYQLVKCNGNNYCFDVSKTMFKIVLEKEEKIAR